jgi:hypothetical protein
MCFHPTGTLDARPAAVRRARAAAARGPLLGDHRPHHAAEAAPVTLAEVREETLREQAVLSGTTIPQRGMRSCRRRWTGW